MHPEVLEVGDRERGLPAVVEQKDGQGGEDDGAVDVVRLGLVGVQGCKWKDSETDGGSTSDF